MSWLATPKALGAPTAPTKVSPAGAAVRLFSPKVVVVVVVVIVVVTHTDIGIITMFFVVVVCCRRLYLLVRGALVLGKLYPPHLILFVEDLGNLVGGAWALGAVRWGDASAKTEMLGEVVAEPAQRGPSVRISETAGR